MSLDSGLLLSLLVYLCMSGCVGSHSAGLQVHLAATRLG